MKNRFTLRNWFLHHNNIFVSILTEQINIPSENFVSEKLELYSF